jgi:antitoxin (DNA-binding transcriptional repressor) of toxin-antitoxin stability system
MNETLISVTNAARNFSNCISLVRYQGASFVLEKNGVPVARIVPVNAKLGTDLDQLGTITRHTPIVALPDTEKERLPVTSTQVEGAGKRNLEPAKLPKRPTLNW